MDDAAAMKRILPNDAMAEQAVIGAMIRENDMIPVAVEYVTKEDFYSPRYGKYFETIVAMNDEGSSVDILTLRDRLMEKGVAEEYYSLENLKNLVDSVPTSANLRNYAKIVSKKATLRKLIKASEEISNECYLENETLDDILEDSEKKIYDITQKRRSESIISIRQTVMDVLNSIQSASRNSGSVTGIPTGYYDLDYKTSGLQKSDFILLAARPSMGKTALALNIAEHTDSIFQSGNVEAAAGKPSYFHELQDKCSGPEDGQA